MPPHRVPSVRDSPVLGRSSGVWQETLYTLCLAPRCFLLPVSLATTFDSASMTLSILDSLYKWSHAVSVFLCLACLTSHNVFRAESYVT